MSRTTNAPKNRRFCPALENLEDRSVPAVISPLPQEALPAVQDQGPVLILLPSLKGVDLLPGVGDFVKANPDDPVIKHALKSGWVNANPDDPGAPPSPNEANPDDFLGRKGWDWVDPQPDPPAQPLPGDWVKVDPQPEPPTKVQPWLVASEKLAILFPSLKTGPFTKHGQAEFNPPESPRASPIAHQVLDMIFAEEPLVPGVDLNQ